MNLFKKKNKKVVTNDAETPVQDKKPAKRGGRKKDGMSAIFHESVIETILDDFATNTSFIISENDEVKYVGLLLDTNDVGGFTKKSNKDEAKGSIIECINSGRIKTLMTNELLDEECMILVPDAITLSAMEEFSLLSDAPYKVVYITKDGEIERTDIDITWKKASDVTLNNGSINDILGITDTGDDSEDDFDYSGDDDDDDFDYSEDDEDGLDEDTTPFDNGDDNEFEEPDILEEDSYEESEDDYQHEDIPVDEDAIFDETDMGDTYEEPEDDIPDEIVNETIIRKFYSDDLGLEVSTEPFDSQFVHNNAYVSFSEARGDGFLNEYLNQMSRDANTELRKLHNDNLFKIRERYFKLVSMHCEEIYKSLDVSDDNTQFGVMANNLKEMKAESLGDLDRLVSAKKEEIQAEWERRLNQVAEEAAIAAKKQYRERFGRQHDEVLYHIEPDIKDQINMEYQDALSEMHSARRDEAAKRLDYGINETLRELSDMYLDMMDKEQSRHRELQKQMHDFIDDNRKDEITRVSVLAEEQRQMQKADVVTAEFTERLKRQSAEFDANRMALQSEIESMQRRTAEMIREKDEDCDDKLSAISKRNTTLQGQIDKLLEQYAEMDDRKNKEFSSRINELTNEKISWEDKCNHVIAIHKRSNVITGLLVGVAIVSALSIGFIVGQFANIQSDKESAQSAIIREFNESLNSIDTDIEDATVSPEPYVEPEPTPETPVTQEEPTVDETAIDNEIVIE